MEIDFSFSPEEKKELLKIARESVMAIVNGWKYEPALPASSRLRQKAGAFVTLHLNGELKGCIGFIEARLPLYETVAEMAAKSAVADPRFDSVSRSDLDHLNIEISVLSAMERVAGPDDVIVGKHGVMIERGRSRGLLLPQVAPENGWNREQFLSHLCLKAGLDRGAYLQRDSKLSVFTAEVFGEERNEKEEQDIAQRT